MEIFSFPFFVHCFSFRLDEVSAQLKASVVKVDITPAGSQYLLGYRETQIKWCPADPSITDSSP
ncbi:MAG: hypothetical protein M9933_15370 [Chitinophagaceae bacterium]|nr:hypothetical protein [Chitinophagaceae bacterium]